MIATRVDLFPREYSKELTFLVQSVNPLSFEVIRQVIEKELLEGYNLDDVFEYVEPEPLGSASIAQVHRARLKDGREVAVKVQRPHIEEQLLDDISVIKSLSFGSVGNGGMAVVVVVVVVVVVPHSSVPY